MASPSESNALEFRVGFFMLLGLAIIGCMVVLFGRVGTGLRKSYLLTVELPNASGLLTNSKVVLSGATVGVVTQAPQVLDHARGVSVQIKIFDPIQIPRNAKVVVGSSGLMGDRFVDVLTTSHDEGGYYQPGETVHGTYRQGMDDVTREAGALVGDLRAAVANLNGTITRVNQDLLKPELFQNLQASMANLNATTKNFQVASEKVNGVLDDARGAVAQVHGAVDGAKDTLAGAKETLSTANDAAKDLRKAIVDVRKVLGSAREVTDQAVHGDGLLGTLISNHELSDNLAALISNLRRTGVLWYKDRPAPTPDPAAARDDNPASPPRATPKPRR